MTDLTIGAKLSWQLAAQEAAAARSEFIEPEHILIGIFSLEKVMGQADEGTPAVLVRGFPYPLRDGAVKELLRPEVEDLFR